MSFRTGKYTSFDFQRDLVIMLAIGGLLLFLTACGAPRTSQEQNLEFATDSALYLEPSESKPEPVPVETKEPETLTPSTVSEREFQGPSVKRDKPIYPQRRPPITYENLASLKESFGKKLNRAVRAQDLPQQEREKYQNIFAQVRFVRTQDNSIRIAKSYMLAGYKFEEDFNRSNGNVLSQGQSDIQLAKALFKAGWIPFENRFFIPPKGAIQFGEVQPKGQQPASTKLNTMKLMFSSGFFFLPPGVNPQTWDQSAGS